MELSNLIIYALIILREFTIIFVLIHMIYKRREPSSMIAWLLFLILVPYLALVLYFIFGTRKVKSKYKKENISVNRKNHTSSTEEFEIYKSATNGKMELFFDYIESYNEFVKSINEAKKSIYICTYVFKYDSVTKEIISLLEEKAKQGLEVKILIDSLGSLYTYLFQSKFKTLKNLGAEIKFFMPIFQIPFRNYINLRNHRKIYIFDNQKVLSGGVNLSNEYFGKEYIKDRWEDILFSCKGSCVEDFFTIFASDWYYATKQRLSFDLIPIYEDGNDKIKVIPSGPDVKTDVLYETILNKIFMAKSRIWIVTPYFIPNETLTKALIIAKHKGVDVKLITPKHSNHILADLTRSSFLRELQDNYIDIMLYRGRMLHAKAILFDDKWAMVGSVNIDNRSLFLNYEVTTFVSSIESISKIETWMDELVENSIIGINSASHARVLVENLMRIVAPQI
ncbi:phospholipase D-like domain-containing protein [Halarcobacter ebronensis]|uniref:Phospholipase n=1 Tax=Halarcobacter ebronensis TaxID=1462615 RepID=A0A4Q1AP55_9BACT|nr:phospholipase D-like domain-containing protein [Halarcobacter ebronensis]QKF80584.1 cardiolipin synthase family protein [Halarcobacter ebronensis]RXK08388.1 phospholipase [Halarcobacter ebronensis]